MVIVTDAFLFFWDHMELYAFPPFLVIRHLFSKLWTSWGMSVILIALFWPSKEWFSDLLQATIDAPRLLLMPPDILLQPHFNCFHDSFHTLQLTAWKLSSDSSTLRAIPGELQHSWRDLSSVQQL